MTVSVNGTSGVTFNDATTQSTSAFYGGLGFRNRIINGAMMIDQRNAGAAVTNVTGAYVLDRWQAGGSTDGAVTVQQSTTAPSGFKNSTKLLVATADASIGAAQYYQYFQKIEGYNVADFALGTASAATFTVSFWVNTSKTGTYCVTLVNSASNRLCPINFTVNSANTWEYKTLTVSGDTTGTWLTDNGIGLYLIINLALGSNYNSGTSGTWNTTQYGTSSQVNWLDTLGATFYITGVQLEKGSTATSFDYRPYGTELALCQRYFFKWEPGNGNVIGTFQAYAATAVIGTFCYLPVQMRTAPTVTFSDASHFQAINASGTVVNTFSSLPSGMQNTVISISTASGWSGTSGLSAGNATQISAANASCAISASSEL
jgi:hypothetical protein